jgi:hypothetical protein
MRQPGGRTRPGYPVISQLGRDTLTGPNCQIRSRGTSFVDSRARTAGIYFRNSRHEKWTSAAVLRQARLVALGLTACHGQKKGPMVISVEVREYPLAC